MRKRLSPGFNWPGFSVAALDPLDGAPRVNACSDSGLLRVCSARPARNSSVPDAECQSRALGVAHDLASRAASVSVVPLCRPLAVE